MNLYVINTGFFKLDGGAMFGVVPKVIWNKVCPADENNLIQLAMRSLLIEDGDRLILIDAGIGKKQDEKFFKHYYLHGEDQLEASLAAHGFSKNDITDVILTHLHFDHCGGAVERIGDQLVLTFPNACYWTNEVHWEWATNPNDREKASFLKENFMPLEESGQLRKIPIGTSTSSSLPTTRFNDNIEIRFCEGHTRAMMLPQIRYKNQTIVFMADLLPTVGHIPLAYVMGYDMFPMQTLHEKKEFLKEAADQHYILFFQHDPVHECCRVMETEKGIKMKECFSLNDIILH